MPATFVLAVWLIASPFFVKNSVRSAWPENVHSQGGATTELMLAQVMKVANGREVRLGPTEFRLLEFFMASPDLRRALNFSRMQDVIRAVRGAGYSLES
ncbi:phosphate ABC transporter permease family protein [Pararhizobium sp. YC-54]|uniref:phosphate ABC transporter permease family protein n=1 Tax=Pararhizobium sp. YC-54 TaxID=2986920 RepID=UPI0021F6FBD0|nr:phosphate ABC transporter permease family protein [Pararhizobium sp. YC-54]MCV9998954.1 phosphate ABC transporter permease family protein [Pararhizobium sp. YC-54]